MFVMPRIAAQLVADPPVNDEEENADRPPIPDVTSMTSALCHRGTQTTRVLPVISASRPDACAAVPGIVRLVVSVERPKVEE
ncbi:MAG: hypothetical protein JSS04_17505 [Proteobacteria bacterium]|nr:hypothetical protein [Pseudomonadota bacterium]